MIVLRLEMWPGGREANKYELCTMTLANIGASTDGKKGDYSVYLYRRPRTGQTTDPMTDDPLRTTVVRGHRRLSQHVLQLIRKAIKGLYPKGK